jgi:heme O synthase-like polyprenyltransferase
MIDLSFLNNTGFDGLGEFLNSVVTLAVTLSALVTVVSLIISGFKFMLSGGDEEKIKEAQKSLTFSILGLILVFLAPTVIEFVLSNIVGI